MSYDPTKDFVGLWRTTGSQVSKAEMPGLDFVFSALVRAGVFVATVSGTAPVANQPTTAWFNPAVPSYNAEGALFLWNSVTGTYAAATPRLFFEFLQTSAVQNGVSWWTVTGGAPANTVGKDGDLAIRTDGVGGIYGPKLFGAWPADPLPGTTNTIDQSAMDATFGTAAGSLIIRNDADWVSLLRPVGFAGLLVATPTAGPAWNTLTSILDNLLGDDQGSVLFRGAATWQVLAPGSDNTVLTTHGPGVDPTWTSKSSEFVSGTVMIFQQTNAPLGWTKQVTQNDVGLRVVSGAVAVKAGSAMSAVFAQSAVGNTTITQATMPSHFHTAGPSAANTTLQLSGSLAPLPNGPTQNTSTVGGDGPHSHSVNLNLAYVDVIIAAKN